jgi:serine-type D-Ala-D-Ala carboxypeptidase/endopeptidase
MPFASTSIAIKLASAACLIVLLGLALFALAPRIASAQKPANLAGDYSGMLSTLHLKLHLKAAPDGTLSGTLDSPDQGANGIPCAEFHVDGANLSFTVPSVHGSWTGKLSADGNTLSGTWNQGSPMPLTFSRDGTTPEANPSRDAFVPAAKPSRVDGFWLGELHAGGATLRVQITVKSDASGREYCSLDSLDQAAMGLDCANVQFKADSFSFDVPTVRGHWEGTLSADGNTLAGTWTQGRPQPLTFTREAAAIALKPPPPPTYDPALAPVSAAELQSVLDRDLAKSLAGGELAPSTGIGVSIGVVEHGVRSVFSYGAAKPDSIFEIGSMTKTFTGLILAQMIEQGKVKLDEPVRELLPPGTVSKPSGPEITLADIATQHSGLPRLPDNMDPADLKNPYADYSPEKLYAFLKQHGVARPADAGFLYSNLGFGLLGQALSVRAGVSYGDLLKEEVAAPLDLADTTIALSPAQQSRFLQAHDGELRASNPWDLNAMSGAGAIRSTAGDMLTYLEAQLHPESLKLASGSGATLPDAIRLTHQLRADAMPGMRIGFAWLYRTDKGNYWHNGATGGFSSYGFFNPEEDCAAIVLVNRTLGKDGSFADWLGEHIGQRLAGKPAISITD